MVPLIINPIYTLYSGYFLGISPFKGLAKGDGSILFLALSWAEKVKKLKVWDSDHHGLTHLTTYKAGESDASKLCCQMLAEMQELGFLNKYGRMQGDYKHVIIFQGIMSSCTANNTKAPQIIKQFLPFALGTYMAYQQGLWPCSRSCPSKVP